MFFNHLFSQTTKDLKKDDSSLKPLYLVTEVSANEERLPYSSSNGKLAYSGSPSKRGRDWIK